MEAKIIATFGIVVGMALGAAAVFVGNAPDGGNVPREGPATIKLGPSGYSGHHSSEIKGVFVVKSSDKAGHENDNLLADPSGIVVGSALSDAAFSSGISVDWGVEYVLVIAVWGDEPDTSLNKDYMRVGIDGDKWGDGSGTIEWETENIGAADSYVYAASFDVGGVDHIGVNFWASPAFTLARDETVVVENILYQVYK